MIIEDDIKSVLHNKKSWALVCEDARRLLPLIPSSSIDSMVTDPPAGIEFSGDEWDKFGKAQKHFTPSRSGNGAPRYGTWRPFADTKAVAEIADRGKAFRNNITPIFEECLRVLKPGAHALVWSTPRVAHWTASALESAGFEIRDGVYRLFGTGLPRSLSIEKSMTARGVEDAENWSGWGTALKPAVECWALVRKPLDHAVAINVDKHGVGALNIDGCRPGDRHPTNVVTDEEADKDLGDRSKFFFTAKSSRKEKDAGLKSKNTHPTVKSIELMKYLCRLVTPPNGVVLDPFTGSGTTCCAARAEGFRFIGAERNQEFYDQAVERINHWT